MFRWAVMQSFNELKNKNILSNVFPSHLQKIATTREHQQRYVARMISESIVSYPYRILYEFNILFFYRNEIVLLANKFKKLKFY